MALNLFGAIGALGRALPGYMQGERQAVQDNWQDLSNYNQVQAGQYQNAYDAALFNPRLSIGYDQAALSRLGLYNQGMQTNINRAAYPGAIANATVQSYYQPWISAATNLGQLGQGLGIANQYWNQGGPQYWGQLGAAMAPGMGGLGGYPDFLQQQQMMPQFGGQLGAVMLPSALQR